MVVTNVLLYIVAGAVGLAAVLGSIELLIWFICVRIMPYWDDYTMNRAMRQAEENRRYWRGY